MGRLACRGTRWAFVMRIGNMRFQPVSPIIRPPCCAGRGGRSALAAVLLIWGCALGCTPGASSATTRIGRFPAATDSVAPETSLEPAIDAVFSVVRGEDVPSIMYQNGREAGYGGIVEAMGGGVGILDFDRDGLHDLFFPGGGQLHPDETMSGVVPVLCRNLGDWRFRPVSEQAGVEQAPFYNHGCAAADFDEDGFTDVLMSGYGGVQLFHNQGDGTFAECRIEAGLDDALWSVSGTWADFDGDGYLDLYIAHYANWSFANNPECMVTPDKRDTCRPQMFDPLPHALYRSRGDGTFYDSSAASGLHMGGRGMGAIAADIDHDGDVDLYVANDTSENYLYLNDGHGLFTEEGVLRGAAVDENGRGNASMGLELLDFDGDGWSDLFVTNYEGELYALYKNLGGALFDCASQRAGLALLGMQFVGWGTVAFDIDRDGDEDLVVVNGHAIYYPTNSGAPRAQLPVLLQNDRGRGQFRKVDFPAETYFGVPHTGRGLAMSDLDGDGDLDLVTCNADEPAVLLRNDTVCQGRRVQVRLVGRKSNRDAIGARLVLHTSAGDQLRHVKGGASYESTSDLCIDWGVSPAAEVSGLTIFWPSAIRQEISNVEFDRVALIVEPDAAP